MLHSPSERVRDKDSGRNLQTIPWRGQAGLAEDEEKEQEEEKGEEEEEENEDEDEEEWIFATAINEAFERNDAGRRTPNIRLMYSVIASSLTVQQETVPTTAITHRRRFLDQYSEILLSLQKSDHSSHIESSTSFRIGFTFLVVM